ncbi:MAG: hypothetical protein DI547_02330 [Sphingobium sp.]|nr:MAG: hypothetical protein DI547_02330 [Sphingobium sp.]
MTHRLVSASVTCALLSAAIAPPLAAQTRPAPTDGPQILPVPERPTTKPWPGGPQIQPPRPDPNRPNPGWGDNNGNNGRTIRCESRRGMTQRCSVRTENRVQLIRRLGGTCTQGRTWGYANTLIWVSNGCRAEFAYGRWAGGGGGQYPGYPYPEKEKDKGPSTGAIIAGVAVAGGLIALLASSANKKKKAEEAAAADPAPTPEPATPATFPPGPPAALVADLAPLPTAARPSVQTCLYEAARQIGATGGTRLSYDRLVSLEQGNGGWRFGASLTATYPDGDRTLPLYCRATPTKVIQLDFANGG